MGAATLATLAASVALTNVGSAQQIVPFDTEQFDDNGYFTLAAPTRMTVPAGMTRARVTACVNFNLIEAGLNVRASILKNGQIAWPGVPIATAAHPNPVTGQQPRVCLASGQIAVAAGDYFEVAVQVAGETTYEILGSHRTSFGIEAV